MPENRLFPPEGLNPAALSLPDLRSALDSGQVLEAVPWRCDAAHTLHFRFGAMEGRMPRSEAVAPWINGAERGIAVLSRVGRDTCFTVRSIQADEKGAPGALPPLTLGMAHRRQVKSASTPALS